MQTYDIFMILVLAAATLFGFWKGMAWQVASLASLIVSFFVARRYADQLAPYISDHPGWNKAVAMLAIYIGTSFVIWTLFRIVSGMIDRVKLDGFDHQMGALIGFAKGVLLCIVITFFAVAILPPAQKDMIIASRAGEYIVKFLDKTDTFVPPEIHDVIHPYVERIERQLDPNQQSQSPLGFQAQWPVETSQPSAWPEQPAQPPQQQPSVYQQQPPAQQLPQPQSQPIPAWPTEPQTADRPGGSPI